MNERLYAPNDTVGVGFRRKMLHHATKGKKSTKVELPVSVQAAARANGATARELNSVLREYLVEGAASAQQAAALTDLQGKPLIVLTADTGHDAKWQSAQDHLATLSTNSVHRVAKATTHQSLIDDEADSAAASAAGCESAPRTHRNGPERDSDKSLVSAVREQAT